MNANELRAAIAAKYRTIIGRNKYSQAKRDFCYKKNSDGNYYSDCSSSISYTYKECGCGFGILNTVGMYQSKKFTEVPVVISKGQIVNPDVLRIGDMLLYAGNDSSRSYAGYVGHVEMVGEISNGKYTLYGHGSGTPKKTEMVSKNKSRYNTKASTKLGHRGLIKVVRFIQDDTSSTDPDRNVRIKSGYTVNIRTGAGTDHSATGKYANGGNTYAYTETKDVSGTTWYHIASGWISGKYAEVV